MVLLKWSAAFDERCGVCAELSSDSAALRSGFGFGSAVARQAASVPESLRETSNAVLETSRSVPSLLYVVFLGSDFASVAGTAATAKMKQGLRRLRRLSGARLGAYQRAYGGVRKILECFSYDYLLSSNLPQNP